VEAAMVGVQSFSEMIEFHDLMVALEVDEHFEQSPFIVISKNV